MKAKPRSPAKQSTIDEPISARKPRSAAKAKAIPTTAQSLGSLLKSARDIMRKDKGLNGDLDRLPLLTWIMFLKFLDDLELQREEEAKLAGKKFRPAIEPPYRWRDWASNPQGVTGDELLSFINLEKGIRPDGTEGAGLFAYLRNLTSSNGDDRRDVIATVFRGVDNRMKSGYLLRDVIDKISGIHFTSSAELHTLSALYESMLREMRDAAGDSGEIYTPRPVVRFMVMMLDPQLGETVLDPAGGTGGMIVESYKHLSPQVKTVADRQFLQNKSLFACEPKPLPYLLCQMNLLLHGLDSPHVDHGNSLRFKLTEIGEKDRVDIIVTNPPFGGEEEKGIQSNFPEDMQTSPTCRRNNSPRVYCRRSSVLLRSWATSAHCLRKDRLNEEVSTQEGSCQKNSRPEKTGSEEIRRRSCARLRFGVVRRCRIVAGSPPRVGSHRQRDHDGNLLGGWPANCRGRTGRKGASRLRKGTPETIVGRSDGSIWSWLQR